MTAQNFGHLCLGALLYMYIHKAVRSVKIIISSLESKVRQVRIPTCSKRLRTCSKRLRSRSVKIISNSLATHLSTKSKASEKDGIPTSLLGRCVEAI